MNSGSFFAKASDFMVVNNELLFSTDPIGESGGENQDCQTFLRPRRRQKPEAGPFLSEKETVKHLRNWSRSKPLGFRLQGWQTSPILAWDDS